MPPQLRPILEKDYPEFLEHYLKMDSLLARLYYARVAVNEPLVIKLLAEVDSFYREKENWN